MKRLGIFLALISIAGFCVVAQSTHTTDMNALVAAAQKEGQLTVIALPHSWVNYGEMIQRFHDKYGIQINELNPDGSSAEEIEAIKANKGNMGPQAPDVIDVGLSFGPKTVQEGLLAPYKVQTWNTIPANVKDSNGYWYGDYYGALAFEVNTDIVKDVPKDWSDLLKPEYKGQFALSGDPRISSQAQMTVVAAALSQGGSLRNITPGLKFFDKLNKVGNFVPLIAITGTVASGETPVTVVWDYNALADKDKLAGNPNIAVVIPASGVVAGIYIQGISAYAPHPNAARLWEEFLYSDEGQLIWLKGYGHPIRYADLARRGVVPADLAAKLPPASAYAKVVFPSLEDQEIETKAIVDGWDKVVNVNIQKQ